MGKAEPGTKIGPVDCDAPLAAVQRRPIKANVSCDLPTVGSLKLRLLPDQFVAGACFFYSGAQSMHAIGSDPPLSYTSLWAKAIAVYRESCIVAFSAEDFVLLVKRDIERGTWGARPQGRLPELFASLAEHVNDSVVLLRTNMYNIVASSFGMGTTLTSATFCLPKREAPLCVNGCGDMGEHCERATVVVIAEAERDGYGSGGRFRGAVFDHSLEVAPFCTLHGVMSMLLYRTGLVAGFRAGKNEVCPVVGH